MKFTLHEVIVVILYNKPNRTATIQEIADEINELNTIGKIVNQCQ